MLQISSVPSTWQMSRVIPPHDFCRDKKNAAALELAERPAGLMWLHRQVAFYTSVVPKSYKANKIPDFQC